MSGTFVSFEGIDGAGKSTHIAGLAAAFQAQGRAVTLTREPGGTALAEQLRTLVLNAPMDPMTEALLVFAARRDHIVQVIAPALARGEVVLCDRFTDATFAYQGGGRGFDWDVLCVLERWVQGPGQGPGQGQGEGEAKGFALAGAPLLQPALTIWFDLPPAVAAQRLVSARVPDKFEAQPQAFFEQVAAGYGRRFEADPARFARINANQGQEQVWAEVLAAVRRKGFLP